MCVSFARLAPRMRMLLVTVSLALLLAPSEQQLLLRRDEQDEGSGDAPRHPPLPRLPALDTESSGDLPRTTSHHLPDDGDFVDIGSGELPTLKTMRTVGHNITLASLIPDATTSRGPSSVAPTSTAAASSATSAAHRRLQPGTDTIDIDSLPSVTQGVQRSSSSGRSQPPPSAHARSTAAGGVRQPHSTSHRHMNNVVPTQPTDDRPPLDEGKEEDSNMIGNAGYAVAESRMGFGPAHGGLHPGLLAAVIGGGVVGLLCAILLVMFVVYRLRKRDEGGYTTVDSKPRLNTYTKASSREFYA